MKIFYKTILIIYIAPAILFPLLLVYGIFSKLTGIVSFTLELFTVLSFDITIFVLLLIVVPIIVINEEPNKFQRFLLVLLSVTVGLVSAVVQKPQESIIRFYFQTQGHLTLNNLKTDDVSYISIDNIVLTNPEQISQIVEALNDSAWYSPNHEQKGKEVSMIIVLQSGQTLHYHLSRFHDENSADLLFIRPLESGFLADGNAYIPNLPSILENVGYTLAKDY
jgi:hypothetical protein